MSLATHPHVETSVQARFPFATFTIIAVNAAFAAGASGLLGAEASAWLFARLAHSRAAVWEGEWWRLLTGTLLHEGGTHFALNMILAGVIGTTVERAIGAWRFAAIYAGTALGGALIFQAVSSAPLGIGASGAIFGIAGAMIRLLWVQMSRRGDRRGRLLVILLAAVFLAADQLLALVVRHHGFGIAVSAHEGGFFTGLLLAHALRAGEWPIAPPVAGAPRRASVRLPALALLALAAGALVVWGCFLPRRDPTWEARERGRALDRLLEAGELESALAAWKQLGADGNLDRGAGHALWDGLVAAGRDDLAMPVLDLLIADVEAEIPEGRGAPLDLSDQPAWHELFNEAAWYAGLKGEDLGRALDRADLAVRLVEARPARGWFEECERASRLAMCLNTRGWIKLRLGYGARGVRDLAMAAELAPTGPNLLYLAVGLLREGDARPARDIARRAETKGGFSRHERRLLEDLRVDTGGW